MDVTAQFRLEKQQDYEILFKTYCLSFHSRVRLTHMVGQHYPLAPSTASEVYDERNEEMVWSQGRSQLLFVSYLVALRHLECSWRAGVHL